MLHHVRGEVQGCSCIAGPIVPFSTNEGVLETKKYKRAAKRVQVLEDRQVSSADIEKMASWQDSTPLGTARFRWKQERIHLQEYDDNGYL